MDYKKKIEEFNRQINEPNYFLQNNIKSNNIYKEKIINNRNHKKDTITKKQVQEMIDSMRTVTNFLQSGNYKESKRICDTLYVNLKDNKWPNYKTMLNLIMIITSHYIELGDYKKAFELTERVYEKRKEELGENHPDTLKALHNLAILYANLGDNKKAFELTERVYEKRKEKLGENHPNTLNALHSLANRYANLGDYKKSFELTEQVYKKMKVKLGENHPNTVKALQNLAHRYANLGDYKKSFELTEQVYKKMKVKLGEKHPDTLNALGDLAVCYGNLGDKKTFLELTERVYEKRKEKLGEKHLDTLRALYNLAVYYANLGDNKKAFELTEQVYKKMKETSGEKHPDTLNALHNLANCYANLGDYKKAFELTKKVYERSKEILGEKHPDTLKALHSLANRYANLEDKKKAFELTERVYKKMKETLGEKHSDTLTALGNLAIFYGNLGDKKTFLELTERVYEKRKEMLGEKHPDTLNSLNNLANCYDNLGNEKKAFELTKLGYKEMKETLGENHSDTLKALNNLSTRYDLLGDYKKAIELAKQVYEKRKEILGENHPDTLNSIIHLITILFNFEEDENNNDQIRKYFVEYYENISNIKNIAFNINDIESRRNFLKVFYIAYDILKSCVFERKFNELLNYVFINKNLSFEIDVRRFHNEYLKEIIGLDEVINKIDNKLIIDFYELKDNKYGLILIKKGRYVSYVIEYENIIDGSFIEDNDFIGSVENYDHIYICPDGKLYNISFERIIDSSNNISYLSSVQTLFQKREDEKTDNEEEMVSFVYPDFSGKISDENDRGKNKGVLYGSYLEGMFIKEIYEDQASIYSLEKANHDNFFNTKRPHIFHVSTHGDYLENENLDPMDRGILCLSGYNKEEYKGYISAKEIQYMDLKNTELVVLSACNTGMGENIEGEGIYGIRRAFELAGCKTLLLTVEEIDDYNSAIFMKVFYERYRTNGKAYKSYKETKEYLKQYGIKELKELRDVFKKEMESKIKSRLIYMRNLKELDKRLEESEKLGGIVKRRGNQYIKEDWNGFIIQGLVEEL